MSKLFKMPKLEMPKLPKPVRMPNPLDKLEAVKRQRLKAGERRGVRSTILSDVGSSGQRLGA